MDSLDATLLARIQFAFTISFHFLFPAFTIGLASYLAVLEALWLVTNRPVFRNLFDYWKKAFAVVFGMGVVSGIVMTYQFGTNWSVFAEKTGAVLGPVMAYEVLTAFFLEAGFLGVMLFGLKRVGPGFHMFATTMVAIGTAISAFWILSASSWMHTPAGFATDARGNFIPVDWLEVIFNPSFPYRFAHTLIAAYLTTAFAIGGVAAWHLLHDRHNEQSRVMFSMAMWMATIVAPIQIIAGDFHGLNTLHHQPAKIAAMEGHFETQTGAPLLLFGWPDMAAEETRYAIGIPKLGSLILAHSLDGKVAGLKEWPKEDRPNATIVFWTFRIMVGIGVLMAALGIWSLVARFRGQLYDSTWLHRSAVLLGPSGFIAVLAGWFTTEVGRQPYTVYGVLRTADSVAPIGAAGVAGSLAAFVVVYFIVFGVGTLYVFRLLARAPEDGEGGLDGWPTRAAGITPVPALTSHDAPEAT